MSSTDVLLEYYKESKIRLGVYLNNVNDKQLLSNYLTDMNSLISEQLIKVRQNPNNRNLVRGLGHMKYVKEQVYKRYNQINKG